MTGPTSITSYSQDIHRLTSEFTDLQLEIAASDGSPVALRRGRERIPLQVKVTLITEGSEVRAPQGGLDYPGAVELCLAPGTAGLPGAQVCAESRSYRVPVQTTGGDWEVVWHYDLRATEPGLSVRLEAMPLRDGAVLRNIRVDVSLGIDSPEQWRIQAPGSKVRVNLELTELSYPTIVQTLAGVEGSTGLIAFERHLDPLTMLLWPMSTTNYGEMVLRPAEGSAVVEWITDVAGMPPSGSSLTAGPLCMDLLPTGFSNLLHQVPQMLEAAGITSPADPPAWARNINLYEVQIGFGVFRDGYRYEPYTTAEALLADLDRIQGLGYNCLQLMPRQPYPSYNVHDYDDITTSWADEATLRRIVDACHERGMHVILDILLHGVIDNEALDAAIGAIGQGPYVGRLAEPTGDITTLESDEMDEVQIAWTRHVLDFEPYWRAGSPKRHPLVDEHPEWFTRDSAGSITGMYTQAFDVANPAWQDYFIARAISLMERLGIDGYRLDAPSYNYFMNWSERTRSNASVSMLGCLTLFPRLREAMRTHNPQSLLYTEPSGALYRTSVDIAYNYDEQWLVRAVMERGAGKAHWVRNARELGQWIAQRDATLPKGSLTAHHMDSHDTFWWPDPGSKWRREQYGLPATTALMHLFFLSGGPYMTYVGGEVGMERQVQAAAAVRRQHPNFADGYSDYASVIASSDDVYAVIRESEGRRGLLLVNLSDQPVQTLVRLAGQAAGNLAPSTPDLLGGPDLEWESESADTWRAGALLDACQAAAFDLASLGE